MAITKIKNPDGSWSYRSTNEMGEDAGVSDEDAYLNERIQTGVKTAIDKQNEAAPQLNADDIKKRQQAMFGTAAPPAKLAAQKISMGPMAQVDPALLGQRTKFIQARRDELSRGFNSQRQNAQDAISRRFSAMGMGNSGAAMKLSLQADSDVEQARQDAANKLGQEEMTQQLQLEQSDLARRDAYDARKMALDQANADTDLKTQMANLEIENKYKDRDMAEKQFILDQDTTAFNKKMAEIEARRPSSSGGGGCCYIFLEARYKNGALDSVVRRYRDEHMTDRNRRGYYKLSEVLVPLMRKSKLATLAVRLLLTDPLVSYGKYHYGEGSIGLIFKPVVNFWMKAFDYLGGDHEFVRENGEVI